MVSQALSHPIQRLHFNPWRNLYDFYADTDRPEDLEVRLHCGETVHAPSRHYVDFEPGGTG